MMTHLEIAHIILILVSPDFVASPCCAGKEIERCMQRHQEDVRVIPLIVRGAMWEYTPFGELTPLPSNGRAIKAHRYREKALLHVTHEIRKMAEEFVEKFTSQPSLLLVEESSHSFLPSDTLQSTGNVEMEDRSVSQDLTLRFIEEIGQISRNMQFVNSEENLESLVRWSRNFPSAAKRFEAEIEVVREYLDQLKRKMGKGDDHDAK